MRLTAGILVLTAPWFGAGAAEARTTFEGRWTCAGRAVPDARVELWREGPTAPYRTKDRRVARGWTNDRGRFGLVARGAGRARHYVRLLLQDRTGIHVKHFPAMEVISDSRAARAGPRSRTRNLGAVRVKGDTVPCELLRALRRARSEYRKAVGAPLPFGRLRARVNSVPAFVGGGPYAHYTTIHWPPGGEVDMTSVRHELGHTVRHRLDGSYGHFASDAVAFFYLQRHTFCQQTEPGFAFNEGWAEYWSREYVGQSCPDPGNFAIEGNVALALADLQRRCPDATRRTMVDTLRRHPGEIHTVPEFRDRLPCTRILGARSGWCSPAGDWCVAIYLERGHTMLSLRTFSFRGRVRVCVDPPRGGPTCRRFPLRRRRGGLFVAERRWSSSFPDRGKGRYRVQWRPEAFKQVPGSASPWRIFER